MATTKDRVSDEKALRLQGVSRALFALAGLDTDKLADSPGWQANVENILQRLPVDSLRQLDYAIWHLRDRVRVKEQPY